MVASQIVSMRPLDLDDVEIECSKFCQDRVVVVKGAVNCTGRVSGKKDASARAHKIKGRCVTFELT